MPRVTALNVNGKKRTVDVDASVSLLSVLHDDLDLTGTGVRLRSLPLTPKGIQMEA